jgi:general secretion pathway protein F
VGRPGAAVSAPIATGQVPIGVNGGESFRYRAARPDGTMELGELRAASREGAITVLGGRGLFPIEVAARPAVRARRARLSPSELALGLRVLATLLEAGLPMTRALGAFEDLAPPAWRTGLAPMRDQVREGQSLGAALARSPLEIPPLVVGIIQAGEAGSGVAAAVRGAAELTEHAAALRTTIRAALTYPVILACAGAASVGLLVEVVLPRFALILTDLGQALPPTTRFVIDAAAFLRVAALPAIGIFAALGLLWRQWTASEAGRVRWHAYLLTLPGVGTVRRAAATSRGCSAAAALLHSGVPIAGALRHAATATGDAAIAARLLAARERVVAGQRISRALEATDALTPTAVRLVGAGEETGRLAELLEHAARIERERAQDITRAAVRLLEPGLILVFGALVALVAAALLQAVYSVRPGG